MECPVCYKTVSAGIHGMKVDCGHWIHTKCMNKKNPDFEKCIPTCNPNQQKKDFEEPSTIDGRDYVMNPPPESFFTRKPKEPYIWLKEGKTLDWIIKEKGYGLQQ